MSVVLGGEKHGSGGVVYTVPGDRPIADLWERVVAHGPDDIPTQEFSAPVNFDVSALTDLLRHRPVPGVDAADLVDGMRGLEAWEAGVSPGNGPDQPPAEAWVMLHGATDPERVTSGARYRPSLIVTLSGYSAIRACSGVRVAVAPVQYDEQCGDWNSDVEYPVVGFDGSSGSFPGVEERLALRSLAKAVCDVVPLPAVAGSQSG